MQQNPRKLSPTLIEYSSPKNREGVRRYFKGEYKIDYAHSSQEKDIINNRRKFVLFHQRSKTENAERSGREGWGQGRFEVELGRKVGSQRVRMRSQQQFQRPYGQGRNLDIKFQSIRLPKIDSRTNPQSPPPKPRIHSKQIHYICGNKNCPSKPSPSSPSLSKSKSKSSPKHIKPRKLKIPIIPEIRRRYTPTFVCSRDNPLPCFKIYQTLS